MKANKAYDTVLGDFIVPFPVRSEIQKIDLRPDFQESSSSLDDVIDFHRRLELIGAETKRIDQQYQMTAEIRSCRERNKNYVVLSDPIEDALFSCAAAAVTGGILLALIS